MYAERNGRLGPRKRVATIVHKNSRAKIIISLVHRHPRVFRYRDRTECRSHTTERFGAFSPISFVKTCGATRNAESSSAQSSVRACGRPRLRAGRHRVEKLRPGLLTVRVRRRVRRGDPESPGPLGSDPQVVRSYWASVSSRPGLDERGRKRTPRVDRRRRP